MRSVAIDSARNIADTTSRRLLRVTLDKFEAKQAQFQLSHYDLAVWDVVASRWTVPSGDFTVYVGRSAFDDESIQGVIPASWLPGPEDDIYAY